MSDDSTQRIPISGRDITDAVVHELQALADDRVPLDSCGWVARELWSCYVFHFLHNADHPSAEDVRLKARPPQPPNIRRREGD